MTNLVFGETVFQGKDRIRSMPAASSLSDRSMQDVVRLVLREAREDCANDCCAISATLDLCVEQTVASLWPNPLKTFIPLLALRRVQDCIRNGSCDPSSGMR